MKKFLSYAASFLTVLCALLFSSFQNEKNMLEWKASRPLTWNDFKGKPEKRFAAASTHYDILKDISISDKNYTVTIRAVFFTDKSWKKTSWINDEVLIHEQKHFDIVEIYARKMRRALSQKKINTGSGVRLVVDSIYQKYDKQMDAYQDLYDEESDGSMNGNGQRKWNKKIKEELEQLNDYSSAKVMINLNP